MFNRLYVLIMESIGQSAGKLIDALNEGYILFKEYKDGEKQFLFYYSGIFETRGWCSALGTIDDRLVELIKEPGNWKIFPDFNMNTDVYPFPWSAKF